MSWLLPLLVVLVVAALLGELWRRQRHAVIRPGQYLKFDGGEARRVVSVHPYDQIITLETMPDDLGAGDSVEAK